MENPVCEKCEAKGMTRQTEEVHHKIPWETGGTEEVQWRLFTDWDNLESLCGECHNAIHQELKK
jgi:predicted HNH restriction endonuclease